MVAWSGDGEEMVPVAERRRWKAMDMAFGVYVLILAALIGGIVLLSQGAKAADLPKVMMGSKGVSIEEIKIDTKRHKLVWAGKITHENGKTEKFVFEIDPDAATMHKGKDQRRYFEPLEAAVLHNRLTWLFMYSVESSFWWFDGRGSQTPLPPFDPGKVLNPSDIAKLRRVDQ